MFRFAATIMMMILCLSGTALGQVSESPQASLDCGAGPLPKTYGGTPWLVYACSDGKSIVVVADAGNPGSPFYFMIYPKDGERKLVGEGTGKKSVTDAAHKELAKLTEQDIANLIAAARQVPK